jgi:nucleoid-associated protein YgaU
VVLEEAPDRVDRVVTTPVTETDVDDDDTVGINLDDSLAVGDRAAGGLDAAVPDTADTSAFGDGADFELAEDADAVLAEADLPPVRVDPIRTPAPNSYTPPMPPAPGPRETTLPRYESMTPVPPRDAVSTTTIAAPGTYTVTEEDTTGFWGIAMKYYGEGKYFELIQQANPQVESRALRPGTMLKMPPKPTPAIATPAADRSRNGQVATNSAGQRVYTVSETDTAGLWGIAQKMYGKGHLYPLIQKANPTVDATKLNAGDQLIIPAQPTETTLSSSTGVVSAVRAAEATRGQTIMENGQRYYIVAGGDAGFWTVSKKVYGDGKYLNVVAEANPGVSSDTLQPGDKLRVPPLPPEAERRARTAAPTAGGVVAQPIRGGAPEPDFGP